MVLVVFPSPPLCDVTVTNTADTIAWLNRLRNYLSTRLYAYTVKVLGWRIGATAGAFALPHGCGGAIACVVAVRPQRRRSSREPTCGVGAPTHPRKAPPTSSEGS